MQNNHSDKFEQAKLTQSEIDSASKSWNKETNFFLSGITSLQSCKQEQSRRLNDYDFNLLQEDAYKDIEDELFKIEYKISKIEENLNLLDYQIQAARDISDYDLINELSSRKLVLSIELENLIATYNKKSLSARFSGRISSIFSNKTKDKFKHIKTKLNFLAETILSKLPKQLSTVIELKKSLSKLKNINRSVDELMSLNAPYGEKSDKYEQLSKYIIKANSIQSKISRDIK